MAKSRAALAFLLFSSARGFGHTKTTETKETEKKVEAPRAPTARDALLCAAHKRISGWYEKGEKQTKTMYRNEQEKIELRFMDGMLPCGGDDAIVTFANYTIEGVKPIHVYSAIVNMHGQLKWNPSGHEMIHLKDDVEQGVRGMKLSYYATPFPDRKVYEWEAYDLTAGENWRDATDLWFSAASSGDDVLKSADTEVESAGFLGMSKPVEAFNCLSAHHVRWAPDGKTVHGSFTNTINGKPPFNLPPAAVSEMTWGKTVDWMKALQVQAKKVAAQDEADLWLPPAELTKERALPYKNGGQCSDMLDTLPLAMVGLYEDSSAQALIGRAASNPVLSALVPSCVAVFALAACLAWKRTRSASSLDAGSNLLTVEADDEPVE
eukprot:TRINITY_DN16560_c0_g1_i1.p1 TRINITY_DN16560_c0_g1~~TRINITY_DN16560_c0_g1_i1.p1  ORF type:complete len:379 (+),score=107.79 TRINITY_DN16560_c0_g1_i1:75-1211(+)